MLTLYETAARAVAPWNSVDAVSETSDFERLPQQNIEVCLMCKHCAAYCDNCRDWQGIKSGRPRKEIDTELLREMMHLRKCNKECCQVLGISERTLQRAKKMLS